MHFSIVLSTFLYGMYCLALPTPEGEQRKPELAKKEQCLPRGKIGCAGKTCCNGMCFEFPGVVGAKPTIHLEDGVDQGVLTNSCSRHLDCAGSVCRKTCWRPTWLNTSWALFVLPLFSFRQQSGTVERALSPDTTDCEGAGAASFSSDARASSVLCRLILWQSCLHVGWRRIMVSSRSTECTRDLALFLLHISFDTMDEETASLRQQLQEEQHRREE